MLRTLVAVLTFIGATHAQNVWVVDGQPGPGVDFTNLQTAFDTAADGDVLVLRAKFDGYTGATLFQKGLTLIADAGEDVRIQSLTVRQLDASQRLVISNIDVWNDNLGPESGLNLRNSTGAIWLEDCELRGRKGWPVDVGGGLFVGYAGEPGLDVNNTLAVSVARCTIRGGDGFQVHAGGQLVGHGGDAIRVRGAAYVNVQGSTLRGGAGGGVDVDTVGDSGAAGGFGVNFENGGGQVLASAVFGGAGGQGGSTFDPFTGQFLCGAGGAGGDAIGNRTQQLSLGLVEVGSNTLQPGAGGSGCGPGAPGVPVDGGALNVVQLATSAYATQLVGPHFEGQPLQYQAQGPAGSFGVVAISASPGASALPGYAGHLLLSPTGGFVRVLGLLPATLGLPAPHVAAVGGALQLFTQLVGYDPATGAVTLSEPNFGIVFDAAAY